MKPELNATEPLPGDDGRDLEVNGDDYEVRRSTFGPTVVVSGIGADGNHNGVVDAPDYVDWRNNVGRKGLIDVPGGRPVEVVASEWII